jgi:predicted aconitase
MIGKAPYADLHTDEGRKGDLLVKLKTEIHETADYDALGYYVGSIPFDVPVFVDMPKCMEIEQLKQMGAASATSGSVGMYHIVGLTAESPTVKAAFQGNKPQETVTVGDEEIKEAYEKLATYENERVDHVLLGCPHYTLKQLMDAAALIRGKSLHRETKMWILVPPSVRSTAERMGLAQEITKAGASLLAGCWSKGSLTGGMNLRSGMILATGSAKCAHYSRAVYPGIGVWFGTMRQCVDAAIKGRWRC